MGNKTNDSYTVQFVKLTGKYRIWNVTKSRFVGRPYDSREAAEAAIVKLRR